MKRQETEAVSVRELSPFSESFRHTELSNGQQAAMQQYNKEIFDNSYDDERAGPNGNSIEPLRTYSNQGGNLAAALRETINNQEDKAPTPPQLAEVAQL